MPKTTAIQAPNQQKQKIILAVLGVLLLAAMAIQGPKLLGGSSSASAAAPASTETTDSTGATDASSTAASATAPTAPTVPAGVPRAVLVGVTVGSAGRPRAGEGQLRSFTLFKQKDPFVQQAPTESSGATSPTGQPTASDTKPGASDGGSSTTAPAPGALMFATISVNGVDVPIEVKEQFPPRQQLFVLVLLKKRTAKIAVAGGAFTDGQTITLPLGKNVTLVNTATGARYALKLLYVGDQPEQVEGFTQGAAQKK